MGAGTAVRAAAGFACLVIPLLAAACAPSAPPADLAPQGRFAWAQGKFDGGDYGAAVRGFQDFAIRAPLDELADSALFMLGESYLRNGEELLAAGEFERFVANRPSSRLAPAAQFGACRAYWELSPKLPLEQEYTRQAIQECGRLVQFFPDSPQRAAAEEILFEANVKLAAKSYEIATYYFRRGLYESANIYLEKALAEVPPASDLTAAILLALYESYRKVGFESEARALRERLLREYPDSEEARQLGGPPGGALRGRSDG